MDRKIYLNVTEKPSIAKLLTKELYGRKPVHQKSDSKYNPIVEFDYQHLGTRVKMVVTSVVGHIAGMEFAKGNGWNTVDPVVLIDSARINVEYAKDKLGIVSNLRRLAREATDIVLWLDCDLEGEAICFEVLDICLGAKSGLVVHRAHFSATTKEAFETALANLGKPDPNMRDAVLARQEIDLRIGAAFTRLQTLTLQTKFSKETFESVLSYGPCQFPTLGFVVLRDQAIENFIPEKFWQIILKIEKENQQKKPQQVDFKWCLERLFEKLPAVLYYQDMLRKSKDAESGKYLARIESCEKKPTQKRKPYPMTTVTLQRLATARLKISGHQVMKSAEKLYQLGYISYPRTETNSYEKTINVKNLVRNLCTEGGHSKEISDYASKLMDEDKYNRPRNGRKNDKAHPPIHPVKGLPDGAQNAGNGGSRGLTATDRRVYELITRHFLGTCSMDAQCESTKVTASMGGHEFYATGIVFKERNFMEIFTTGGSKDKELPAFVEGERIEPTELEFKEALTTAPKPLTEAALITLMEKNKIGTDATMAEHIQKIKDRGYAELEKQAIRSTSTGKALVEAYQDMELQLYEPELRAEMEKDLSDVAEGLKKKDDVLKKYRELMSNAYRMVAEQKRFLWERMALRLGKEASDQGNRGMNLQIEVKLTGKQKAKIEGARLGDCPRPGCGGKIELKELEGRLTAHCPSCGWESQLPVQADYEFEVLDHKCPLDGCRVLKCKNKFGKFEHYSPHAYSFDLEDSANPAKYRKRGLGMGCKQCTHPKCHLSNKSGYPVADCSECRSGKMVIRLSQKGTHFLSCNNYPECAATAWLPWGTKYAYPLVTDQHKTGTKCPDLDCMKTGHHKIELEFETQKISNPSFKELLDKNGRGQFCLSCDPALSGLLGYEFEVRAGKKAKGAKKFKKKTQKVKKNGNGRKKGGGGAKNNKKRNGVAKKFKKNKKEIVCYHCHEKGHYANECPNRGAKDQTDVCWNCGKKGHYASDCPEKGNKKY